VIEASYPRIRGKTRENERKMLDKPNSDAIVSTLTACFLLTCLFRFITIFVCILRFCDHNESCKRVYYKNDRFFSRFFVGKIWQRSKRWCFSRSEKQYILTQMLTSSLDFLRNNLYIQYVVWNESIICGT
jgi:hypothetical protein